MEREGVVQSVRFFRCVWNSGYHESDPMSALRVYDQSQAVQIEQSVKSRIVHLHFVECYHFKIIITIHPSVPVPNGKSFWYC